MTVVATTWPQEALASLGDWAFADVPLAPFTTYRVGGNAAVLARPRAPADLARIAAVRHHHGLELIAVGKGSNMLVSDDGFAGIAVVLADYALPRAPHRDGFTVDQAAGGRSIVTVPGAASLPLIARRLAAAGIVGFEWAVGIPGSVGGAVKMNAGGHGSDMAAVLVDVELASLTAPRRGDPVRVPVADLGLRFRGSDVADDQLVVSARLGLSGGDPVPAMQRIGDIVRWRRQHQPGGQNCGSVFVNPVPGEVSAGVLIDGLGLRGLRVGGAWVSEKHANFIQASVGGTASDVLAVMHRVRAAVADATGYVLRSEVRLVGFEPAVVTP